MIDFCSGVTAVQGVTWLWRRLGSAHKDEYGTHNICVLTSHCLLFADAFWLPLPFTPLSIASSWCFMHTMSHVDNFVTEYLLPVTTISEASEMASMMLVVHNFSSCQ